jgi:prepilin-type N-terminal cleavage/methylation domain-containing protein
VLLSPIDRVRSRIQNDEGGFTLIELLVVVIIIGILAAIAIPTFLNQRKKGWESAVKSDLRNYAIVMETHLTEAGAYNATTPALPAPVESDGVDITVPAGTLTSDSYCLQGTHGKLGATDIWSLKPGGALAKAACA